MIRGSFERTEANVKLCDAGDRCIVTHNGVAILLVVAPNGMVEINVGHKSVFVDTSTGAMHIFGETA